MPAATPSSLVRHIFIAMAAATALLAQTAVAGPLRLSNGDIVRLERGPGTFGGANGGGSYLLSGVNVASGTGAPFLTFCMEKSENFSLGTNYFVAVNDRALSGGGGVAGTYPGDVAGVAGSFDPLSPATAWLYTQFRANTLQNHVAFNYSSNTDLNALQAALWFLENEVSASELDSKGVALKNAAINAGWLGIGNVRVLNMWRNRSGSMGNYTFSGVQQDQLVLVTDLVAVPEPSSILMALCGVAGFGCVTHARRRRARADA
jgi:hypothetical protein